MFGDFPVKDKIAVITGAGSGINLAFTRLAASHGAKCIIADLRLTPEASAYIETAQNVIFAKCDVTQWADLQHLITVSQDAFGNVPDIYVPGAGVFEPKWSNFWDDSESERYAEVDINVNHPIQLARIAMRALLGADKKGVVLMEASVAGLVGSYAAPLYCATKHAIVGFVKSMAQADALEGVKFVAVCPGIVKTPLWTDDPDKMAQYSIADIPDAAVPVEDVAQTMLELVQDGKYVGGTVFKIDAGVREVVKGEERMLEGKDAEVMRKVRERTFKPITELLKGERGLGRGT